MANVRCSAAEESEDTLNSFTSHTGYEPNLQTLGELNDSSVPFSFIIPSSDQDMDDVTLGEMLTAAHRGRVDYCVPGGMSVSQSSSSVMFDGSGQPDGERIAARRLPGKCYVIFFCVLSASCGRVWSFVTVEFCDCFHSSSKTIVRVSSIIAHRIATICVPSHYGRFTDSRGNCNHQHKKNGNNTSSFLQGRHYIICHWQRFFETEVHEIMYIVDRT